jgi:hypothetical protein
MKKFTIIALVVAITAVFAVTAMATEWNLYGSARMETFWKDSDLPDARTDAFGRSSDGDLTWQFQNNSRVGATVKGEHISGRFEYGARPAVRDSGAVTNFANVRRLFGVWHFAEGWGLKVGKDYTPITFFLSGQVVDADAGLLQVGNAYGARKGLIEIDGKLGPGTLKIAAIDPSSTAFITLPGLGGPGDDVTIATDTETNIPKFEVSYEFGLSDAMSFHAFGGYQYIKQLVNATGTVAGAPFVFNVDENVSSWMIGVGGDMNLGPMFVKPQVSYYSNGAAAGWLGSRIPGGSSALPALDATGNIDDATSLMAMLALGFSPTEAMTLEGGIGFLFTDQDNGFENTSYDAYLQLVWTLAKGVYLVPEVGYRDFGDFEPAIGPEQDLGSRFYAGAKWQIDF